MGNWSGLKLAFVAAASVVGALVIDVLPRSLKPKLDAFGKLVRAFLRMRMPLWLCLSIWLIALFFLVRWGERRKSRAATPESIQRWIETDQPEIGRLDLGAIREHAARLTELGLITSEWEPDRGEYRYSITPLGREYLRRHGHL